MVNDRWTNSRFGGSSLRETVPQGATKIKSRFTPALFPSFLRPPLHTSSRPTSTPIAFWRVSIYDSDPVDPPPMWNIFVGEGIGGVRLSVLVDLILIDFGLKWL